MKVYQETFKSIYFGKLQWGSWGLKNKDELVKRSPMDEEEDIGSTLKNDLGGGRKHWRSQNEKESGAVEELKAVQSSYSLHSQRHVAVMDVRLVMIWVTWRVLFSAKHLDSAVCRTTDKYSFYYFIIIH